MEHAKARELLEKQFAEAVLPALEAQALRAHLVSCGDCRAEYDRLVELEQALEGKPVAKAELERMFALGPPRVAQRRFSRRAYAVAGAIVAAAASLLFVALTPDEFGVRGSASTGRTAWIRVFEKTEAGAVPLGATLRADRGLLFAYTNLRESEQHFMIIAGRDSAGHMHWYHPSSDAPRSIAIEHGVADRELPEAIYSEYATGRLEICAIFTREALSLGDVERTGVWPEGDARDCRFVEITGASP